MGVIAVVMLAIPAAHAGTAAHELEIKVPKGWSVTKAKRGSVDVTEYAIEGIPDAKLVVYPPSTQYGATINKALRTFIKTELKKVVSVYPKRIKHRSTWYGIKHGRLHAMLKAKRGYSLRVVYAFAVKDAIQILVAEAKSSRQVRKLLTILSPVTMGCGLKKRHAQAPEPAPKPAP